MSTLIRNLSIVLLCSLVFGCFVFTKSFSCSVDTTSHSFAGPFCSVEYTSAPFLFHGQTGHEALAVEKFVFSIALVAGVFMLRLFSTTPSLPIFLQEVVLVRYGPYQKRYPIMLPSFQ